MAVNKPTSTARLIAELHALGLEHSSLMTQVRSLDKGTSQKHSTPHQVHPMQVESTSQVPSAKHRKIKRVIRDAFNIIRSELFGL